MSQCFALTQKIARPIMADWLCNAGYYAIGLVKFRLNNRGLPCIPVSHVKKVWDGVQQSHEQVDDGNVDEENVGVGLHSPVSENCPQDHDIGDDAEKRHDTERSSPKGVHI